MKIILTESQFKRVILKEQDDKYSNLLFEIKPYKIDDSGNGRHEYSFRGFITYSNAVTNTGEDQLIEAVTALKSFFNRNHIKRAQLTQLSVVGSASNAEGNKNTPQKPVTPDVNLTDNISKYLITYKGVGNFSEKELGEYEKNDKLHLEKQKSFATARANKVKEVLLSSPLETFTNWGSSSKTDTKSFISNTGGKIDILRDKSKYPVPGQHVSFYGRFKIAKPYIQGVNVVNDFFKQTDTSRSGGYTTLDNSKGCYEQGVENDSWKEKCGESKYYGADKKYYPNGFRQNLTPGGKGLKICKLLTNNKTISLKKVRGKGKEIGLTPFTVDIKHLGNFKFSVKPTSGMNENGELSVNQYRYLMWYFRNEENKPSNEGCKVEKFVDFGKSGIPERYKNLDFSKIYFPVGATDVEHEYVHSKDKHKLVK